MTPRTRGSCTSRSPTTRPGPITRLKTPSGSPARAMISAKRPRAGRHELGGLAHHRAPVRERRRDLPRRDRDREVPRGDDAHHAQRLAQDVDVDARPHAPQVLAGDPQRLSREEPEDLRGALDLADALCARLALLPRELIPQLLGARRELQTHGLERDRPLLRGRRGPARRGLGRRADRGVGLRQRRPTRTRPRRRSGPKGCGSRPRRGLRPTPRRSGSRASCGA